MNIKEFTIDLYEKVYQLWTSCEGVGLGDSDTEEQIDLFLNRNPGLSLVAMEGSDIVGAVLVGHDGRRGFIHHLAVSSDYRRKGIGKELVEQCLMGLKQQGILKSHIFLFNDNLSGLEFWKSIGWFKRDDICIVSKFISPGS